MTTTTEPAELKPCPFCGKDPQPYWNGLGCTTVGCALGSQHIEWDKWQTRTPPAAPVAEDAVEALTVALAKSSGIDDYTIAAPEQIIEYLSAQDWHLRRETKAPDGVASQPEAQSAPAMTEFELKLEAERLAYGAMVDADRMQGIINLAKKYRG